MRFNQRVIATDFRSGVSRKDGANKDRKFISFHCLDDSGRKFDVFQWDDDGRFPKKVDAPCLLECQFELGQDMDGKEELAVLSIDRKSAVFDLFKVIDSLKLAMEKA
jgi:hypothetical protein